MIFAAKAGARRVTAIEETAIADVAEAMVRANGVEGIVTIRRGSSQDTVIDEPADVVIHELLGADPLTENVIPHIVDARQRFLRPGGRLIPYRVDACIVGLEADGQAVYAKFQHVKEAEEFARLHNMEVAPFRAALMDTPLGSFESPRGQRDTAEIRARGLSEEVTGVTFDFRTDVEIVSPVRVRMRAFRRGEMGAYLVYFRAWLDEDISLSNAPFAPQTCWGHVVRSFDSVISVSPGDEVVLDVEVQYVNGRQEVRAAIV